MAKKVTKPSYKPTDVERRQVKMMVISGITQEMIAACMNGGEGIDVKTLRKYYKPELDTAKAIAVANMGRKLYERGIGGSTTDAIFYLKTQGGWKETSVVEADVNVHGALMEAITEGRKRIANAKRSGK